VLVGNSSAGIIEASALGAPVVDVGTRQRGRERARNVVGCAVIERDAVMEAIAEAIMAPRRAVSPYGDGTASARIAAVLASFEEWRHPLSKLNGF
jgi:UDP-N-acetylglucosamine 2-epimerase